MKKFFTILLLGTLIFNVKSFAEDKIISSKNVTKEHGFGCCEIITTQTTTKITKVLHCESGYGQSMVVLESYPKPTKRTLK